MNGGLRKLFDTLMAGGFLALAFYAGILSSEVAQHKLDIEKIQKERGTVKISIEATERLACLESVIKECKR